MQKIRNFLGPGPFAMIMAGIFFSGMAALVKQVGKEIPVFQIIFFRAFVSALVIFGAMIFQGINVKGENQKLLLVRALFGFIAMCLNFYALTKINLGDAALLNQTTPFFVMLLSWFFLKEYFHRNLLYLTILCFFGISIVLRPTGQLFNLGGISGILSAVFAACAYVSIRHLHRTDSYWTMAFYFMIVASLLSFPPMVLTWKTPNWQETIMLIASGILGTAGQLLMTFAYKFEEASWVAPFAYAGVLFAFLWGILFFNEVPSIATLVGAIFTVVGGVGIVKLKNSVQATSPISEKNLK